MAKFNTLTGMYEDDESTTTTLGFNSSREPVDKVNLYEDIGLDI